MIFDVVNDDHSLGELFTDHLMFPPGECIVPEKDVGSEHLGRLPQVFEAVHDERERNRLQCVDHDRPLIVEDKGPFRAFLGAYHFIRIDADDEHVALSLTADEIPEMVEVNEVETTGRKSDCFLPLLLFAKHQFDRAGRYRVVNFKEHEVHSPFRFKRSLNVSVEFSNPLPDDCSSELGLGGWGIVSIITLPCWFFSI